MVQDNCMVLMKIIATSFKKKKNLALAKKLHEFCVIFPFQKNKKIKNKKISATKL